MESGAQQDEIRRHPPRVLAGTMIAAGVYALAAFLIHLRWFQIGDYGVESDFYAELAVAARRLFEGDLRVENYPFKGPMTSFVLAGIHALTGHLGWDWYRTGVLLNALSAGASLAVLHLLLRRLFPSLLAVAVTVAMALQAEFFLLAHKASSDLLYLCLFLATIAALIDLADRRRILAAGVLAGLAFLTRYSGGMLLPAGLAVLWIRPPGMGRIPATMLLVGGFLVPVLPWMVFCFATSGSWLPQGNLMNVVLEFYPAGGTPAAPAEGFSSLTSLIAHDPAHFLTHLLGNVGERLIQDLRWVVGWRLAPLVGLGGLAVLLGLLSERTPALAWARRYRLDGRQMILVGLALLSYLGLCLVFHRPRFALPHAPVYFLLLYGWISGFRRGGAVDLRSPMGLSTLALILLVSSQQIPDLGAGLYDYHQRQPVEVLGQAEALQQAQGYRPGDRLLARRPHLAHYADLYPAAYPGVISGWDDFWRIAHERGVTWIAIGDQERGVPGETRILDALDKGAGVAETLETENLTLLRLEPADSWQHWATVPELAELNAAISQAQSQGDTTALVGHLFDGGLLEMSLTRWTRAEMNLAESLAMWNRKPEALGKPDADYLHLTLALCLLELDRHAEGLEMLEAGDGRLSAGFTAGLEADRLYVAGRLCAGLGKNQWARRHLETALAMYRETGRDEAAEDTEGHLRTLASSSTQ